MIKNSLQKISPRTWRFAFVGIIATSIDFGVLFALHAYGFESVIANIFSTFLAFCFSFFANKHYTFKATDTNIHREIVMFILVTLTGVWVLQSIIIALLTPVLSGIFAGSTLLFITKLAATGASFIWNLVLYPRVVFTKKPAQ